MPVSIKQIQESLNDLVQELILFASQSGVAAAGGLVISGRGSASDGSVYQHSLGIGLLMVEVALGVCTSNTSLV